MIRFNVKRFVLILLCLIACLTGNQEAFASSDTLYVCQDGSVEGQSDHGLFFYGMDTSNVLMDSLKEPGFYFVSDNASIDSLQRVFVNPIHIDLSISKIPGCGEVILRGSSSADSVFWFNGATSSDIRVDSTGNYWIEGREKGCHTSTFISVSEQDFLSFEFELAINQTCNYTDVEVYSIDSEIASVNWSNGKTGFINRFTEDQQVIVEVVDANGCVASDTVQVELVRLEVEGLVPEVNEATCWENGQVAISNLPANIDVELINTVNQNVEHDLENVPEGIYTLVLSNDLGCKSAWSDEILIEQDCLNNYPVFTPDGDGIEDDYFIPHEGRIQIFDRNGVLIRDMEAPAYWDGKDRNGDLVPMGNYMLVTDKSRVVNITIVR